MPQTSPLPNELAPPTAPTTNPVTTPTGNPLTLPTGTPTGGSTAIGAPSSTNQKLSSAGGKIAPLTIPVPVFIPVNAPQIASPGSLPIRLTGGQVQPAITPVTNFSNQTGITPAIELLPEPVFNQPPTKTGECTPDPEAKCRYDNKGIAGKCDEIIEKLEGEYTLEWNLPECGAEFTCDRTGNKSGQGLSGIANQIAALYEVIKVLHENTRCGNEALAIPETWNLKKSIETAQMIIVTKLVVDEDNPTYRRSFTIPHPRYSKLKEISRIKRMRYRRGSCQATIQLVDNSCCVLNCSTPAEAKKVSKYVLQLIHPDWARTAQVKITEKINLEIQPAFVEFHVAKYFQTSDERILPVWSQRIP